jgi:polyphosphate kinase
MQPAIHISSDKRVLQSERSSIFQITQQNRISLWPTVFASIGDHGALNASLSPTLAETWIDRDLSWLDFNDRVLAEALDERTPLLERAKFLAIFTSNLDEFFMKRQAVIHHGTSDAQRALARQVRERLLPLLKRQAECYRKVIVRRLAHVTFGISGLKTHTKTALVVRKEAGGLRCYVHIGTGNYHVKTARLYADVGLFTCDHRITTDVVNLFHYLTGHADQPNCTSLLVAPLTMRPRLLDLIHREIKNKHDGRPARIIAKMNQLEDPDMIEALCEASQAGVPIDLIIRGFCCLRPGVPGHTENIRIRSIIGRFLEHSRIFYFANASQDPSEGEYFIGSADWMLRNLSKRIEVVTPVFASGPKQRLWEFLDICLRDQRQAWVLGQDGKYVQLHPEDGARDPESIGTHRTLMNLALDRADA